MKRFGSLYKYSDNGDKIGEIGLFKNKDFIRVAYHPAVVLLDIHSRNLLHSIPSNTCKNIHGSIVCIDLNVHSQ